MQLISKYKKGIRYLLCVIDLFSKYAWVVPLKDKKGVSVVNAFQKILDSSKRKPNKMSVNQGSEFCNNSSFTMAWKCIQHIMKESLLLMKDLSEP